MDAILRYLRHLVKLFPNRFFSKLGYFLVAVSRFQTVNNTLDLLVHLLQLPNLTLRHDRFNKSTYAFLIPLFNKSAQLQTLVHEGAAIFLPSADARVPGQSSAYVWMRHIFILDFSHSLVDRAGVVG